MKYKKTIMLLTVFSLVFVFSIKKVNATAIEEFNLDTNNCINGSCKVLNQGTVTIGTAKSISYEGSSRIQSGSYTGSMYKILDTYYNQTINEITYKFTTDFATFLTTSGDYNTLTVDDYFTLTSDVITNPLEDYYSSTLTASTLNVLLSKYAAYINSNSISPNYTFSGNISYMNYIEENCVAGAYLILASKENYTTGVTVANVEVKAVNGTWTVTDPSVLIKESKNELETLLSYKSARNLNDFLSAIFNPDFLSTTSNDIAATKNKEYTFGISLYNTEVPTNASNTVKNSNKLNTITIDFPAGINYDLNNVYYFTQTATTEKTCSLITFDNGTCYINNNHVIGGGILDSQQLIKIADYTINDQQLIMKNFYKYRMEDGTNTLIGFTNLQLNDNAVVGTEPVDGVIGNPIKTKYYYLIDAYANDEDTAFEEKNFTNIFYTYNLKINNKNNSEELLNGAVFGIYTDQDCTNQIGENLTIATNGTVTFSGMGTGTYYLKQEKAASGYRLIETNPMEFTLTTDDLVDDEYFEITVTSPASLLLPFTGGSGTIIFTCIGFIAVLGSAIGIYMYIKKKKDKNKEK